MNISIRNLLGLIVAVAVFFVFLLPTHTEVEKDVAAVKYKLGNSYYEEDIKIKISGTIRKAGVIPKTFYGTMQMDEMTLRFVTDDDRFSLLYYSDSQGMTRTYGGMYTSNDFEEVTITKFPWDSFNGDMITFPAKGRNEALVIANRVMKNFLEHMGTNKLE